jgi:hypothetical protein
VHRVDHSSRGVPPSVYMSEYVRKSSILRRPWPAGGCCTMLKKRNKILHFQPNDLYVQLKRSVFSVIDKSKAIRKYHCTTIHFVFAVSPPNELPGVNSKY